MLRKTLLEPSAMNALSLRKNHDDHEPWSPVSLLVFIPTIAIVNTVFPINPSPLKIALSIAEYVFIFSVLFIRVRKIGLCDRTLPTFGLLVLFLSINQILLGAGKLNEIELAERCLFCALGAFALLNDSSTTASIVALVTLTFSPLTLSISSALPFSSFFIIECAAIVLVLPKSLFAPIDLFRGVVLIYIVVLFSILPFSRVLYDSIHETFVQVAFFSIFLIAPLGYSSGQNRRSPVIVVTIGLIVLLVFVRYFETYFERFLLLGFHEAFVHRFFLGWIHPHHLSQFLVVAIGYCGYGLFFEDRRLVRFIDGLVLSGSLIVLPSTFSRVDLFAAALLLCGYVFVAFRKRPSLRKLGLLVLFIGMLAGIFGKNLLSRYSDIGNLEASGRGKDYALTLRMFADQPLTGNGLATRKYLYPLYRYENDPRSGYFRSVPHNVLLCNLAETGIFATLLLLCSIVLFSRVCFEVNRKETAHPVVIAIFGFLALGLSTLIGSFLLSTMAVTSLILGNIVPVAAMNRQTWKTVVSSYSGKSLALVGLVFILTGLIAESFLGDFIQVGQDDRDAMLKNAETVASLSPLDHNLPFIIAEALAVIDNRRADRFFRRAIENNPEFAKYHDRYALYLKKIGRSGEGCAEVERAIELDRYNSGKYYYDQLLICNKPGYWKEVAAERLLLLNPRLCAVAIESRSIDPGFLEDREHWLRTQTDPTSRSSYLQLLLALKDVEAIRRYNLLTIASPDHLIAFYSLTDGRIDRDEFEYFLRWKAVPNIANLLCLDDLRRDPPRFDNERFASLSASHWDEIYFDNIGLHLCKAGIAYRKGKWSDYGRERLIVEYFNRYYRRNLKKLRDNNPENPVIDQLTILLSYFNR